MALSLSDLLKRMLEMSGSDLHITTNSPPQVRVHGHLVPLDLPQLTPAETKQLAYSVMTDSQKHRFEENLELDFSFGLKGLARFRANCFNQRGATAAVFRVIPFEIKSFNQQAVRQAARPGTGHGTDRFREIDHAGGHDRQDQYRAPRSHPHHRGPDRVRAHEQELPGQPA
jgi:Tfp pilus assembly pilus retraction ATPase PilT